MKYKKGMWVADKLEHFFGWEVTVTGKLRKNDDEWFIVEAVNKTTREKRTVAAHINVIPMEATEFIGKGR